MAETYLHRRRRKKIPKQPYLGHCCATLTFFLVVISELLPLHAVNLLPVAERVETDQKPSRCLQCVCVRSLTDVLGVLLPRALRPPSHDGHAAHVVCEPRVATLFQCVECAWNAFCKLADGTNRQTLNKNRDWLIDWLYLISERSHEKADSHIGPCRERGRDWRKLVKGEKGRKERNSYRPGLAGGGWGGRKERKSVIIIIPLLLLLNKSLQMCTPTPLQGRELDRYLAVRLSSVPSVIHGVRECSVLTGHFPRLVTNRGSSPCVLNWHEF